MLTFKEINLDFPLGIPTKQDLAARMIGFAFKRNYSKIHYGGVERWPLAAYIGTLPTSIDTTTTIYDEKHENSAI